MTLKEYKASKESKSCNFQEWFFLLSDEEIIGLAKSENIIIEG